MAAKQIWSAVVMLALAAMSGCCSWCDKWCHPQAPPPNCCVPCCPPAPQCCPTAGAQSVPVPVATPGWRQPAYSPANGCCQ